MPSDLKKVISSSDSLPFFARVNTSPSSPLTWAPLIALSFFGMMKSPASLNNDSYLSVYSFDLRIAGVSNSRVDGVHDPTALTCAPLLIHSPNTTGVGEAVVVQIISASAIESPAPRTARAGIL